MRNYINASIKDMNFVARVAPSVFADHESAKTSDKYRFVNTVEVLNTLLDEGWQITGAHESRTRDPQNKGFQKHTVSLRHPDLPAIGSGVGASETQVRLVNSHNGASSFQLLAEIYRQVCGNGMTVKDSTLEHVRLIHMQLTQDAVLAASVQMLERLPVLGHRVEQMSERILIEEEQIELARRALQLRWENDENGKSTAPISAEKLVRTTRRAEDSGSDLWTVTNRIQENLIRGGLRGYNANGGRTTTREVKSVDNFLSVNQGLYQLAVALV